MLKECDLTPFLPAHVLFKEVLYKYKRYNFVFFDKNNLKTFSIFCTYSDDKRIYIDFDMDDPFDFETIELLSLISLALKEGFHANPHFRMKILTGSLSCILSDHIITDLDSYRTRCSREWLLSIKEEILQFFSTLSCHTPTRSLSFDIQSLYAEGRDGDLLGSFLEELSIAYTYPAIHFNCIISIEFKEEHISSYRNERLFLIANFFGNKGYRMVLY